MYLTNVLQDCCCLKVKIAGIILFDELYPLMRGKYKYNTREIAENRMLILCKWLRAKFY